MKVHVCNPHGYCEGVLRAINIALDTKKNNPNHPVAILGMLVHNEFVIEFLAKHGISTLERPNSADEDFLPHVSDDTIIIFTAHGHPKVYEELISNRGLSYVDATCPKVEVTHDVIINALNNNHQIIYIGQTGHPETEAALSINAEGIFLFDINSPFNYAQISDLTPVVINQTTLSLDELAKIHDEILTYLPGAIIENEICSATRLRQNAVKKIPLDVDIIYIVGSFHSNNTKKLVQVAKLSHPNADVYQIKSVNDINPTQLKNKKYAGVAAGASSPLELTNAVIDYLKQFNE